MPLRVRWKPAGPFRRRILSGCLALPRRPGDPDGDPAADCAAGRLAWPKSSRQRNVEYVNRERDAAFDVSL